MSQEMLMSKDEFDVVVTEANDGNSEALAQLRTLLDERPEIWRQVGDLGKHAELTMIRLIAPIMPFVTEELWAQFAPAGAAREPLIEASWPALSADLADAAAKAELELVERGGVRHEITLEPELAFRMKGIGYTHLSWGHGKWKGELAVEGESWKTADLDEMGIDNLHIQQVMRATSGDETGIGVMEQLHIGPSAHYGFKEFLDPAR